MKVAFFNILNEARNGEQETLMRLQYTFSKQGHTFLLLDKDGYVISEHPDKGLYVEDAGVDYLVTCNGVETSLMVFPDVFSVFLHWAPFGFFENSKALFYMQMLHSFDAFAYSSEKNIINEFLQIPCSSIPFFGPSVPEDYIVKPRFQKKRKLFYVGINFERAMGNMRYGDLLKELDKSGCLEIYGPRKVYGRRNLWSDFRSYRGEIPFDGSTIVKRINEAGVCLALNSPMHNDALAVTNRLYEAAAAGAVIISDDNELIHAYFGDSVFYVDCDLGEGELSQQIIDILEFLNNHPCEAYEMARKSQEVFLNRLSMDRFVNDLNRSVECTLQRVSNIEYQSDLIDVVCFLEDEQDYKRISEQLRRQYYQNIHLIIVANPCVYASLSINYPHSFIERSNEGEGRSLAQAQKCMLGQYFFLMDGFSVLHARHIYKNHEVLTKRPELFAYSGCYLKKSKKARERYIILNETPISRSEFLSFSNVSFHTSSGKSHTYSANLSVRFPKSAGLFRREILTIVDEGELQQIHSDVHQYLACCSIIKESMMGRFTFALTAGYSDNSFDSVKDAAEKNMKTTALDLQNAFWDYTFEA